MIKSKRNGLCVYGDFIYFKTITECANHFKIDNGSVVFRIKSKNFKGWYYA